MSVDLVLLPYLTSAHFTFAQYCLIFSCTASPRTHLRNLFQTQAFFVLSVSVTASVLIHAKRDSCVSAFILISPNICLGVKVDLLLPLYLSVRKHHLHAAKPAYHYICLFPWCKHSTIAGTKVKLLNEKSLREARNQRSEQMLAPFVFSVNACGCFCPPVCLYSTFLHSGLLELELQL